ncbi:hypothetical protein Lesp02_67440 [Lentzea sp. NBRC 105346]|nr:hypothetical protein Lesp02_67440 [Lentzea sp. NBRC 105346]
MTHSQAVGPCPPSRPPMSAPNDCQYSNMKLAATARPAATTTSTDPSALRVITAPVCQVAWVPDGPGIVGAFWEN